MERHTCISDKSWSSTLTEMCREKKSYRPTKHALESDRDANLQAESRTQANRKRYRGVRMRSWGKWVSEIREPKKRSRLWLGSYSTPEAAARAYDTALFYLRGHSASFNFPNSLPFEDQPSLSPRSVQKAAVAAGVAAEKGFRPSNTETLGPFTESAPNAACCGADLSNTNLLSLGPMESDASFQTEFQCKDEDHEPSSVQERASDHDRAKWQESKVNSADNFSVERDFFVDSTLPRGKGIPNLVERELF